MSTPEQQIRPTRWRATYATEFTTRDYPRNEEGTAMHQANLTLAGLQRADTTDVNCSRPVSVLVNLERLDG